ncbi:MAG: ATP-binding protein [Bacteroidota bacterium]
MITTINEFNTWLERYLYYPGDSEETLMHKKIWWLINVGGLFFLTLLGSIIGDREGVEVLIMNIIFTIALLSGLFVFHFYKRGIEGFALYVQIVVVVICSIKVYMMGGLFSGGSAIYVGFMSPLYALTLPNKKRAFVILISYIFLMLLATLMQPVLPETYLIYYYSVGFAFANTMAFFALFYYTNRVEKLKQEEKIRMKELDEFKTKFYTNITHEFRTPLTIILGMADQIKDNPGKWFAGGLEMIKRNGKDLLNLTNQMLYLSKLDANAMPVNLIQDDIAVYSRYLVESFHSLAGKKNIRLLFSSDPQEIRMDFDPDKIQDIMSNLLSNAIKFTQENGLIQVSVSKADLASESKMILSVTDTGIGIPAEHLPNVFDRYFQADNHKEQLSKGTGLGLALTKELVRLLKGEITVQSKQGKGSTFTVQLPISNTASEDNSLLSKEISLSSMDSDNIEQVAHQTSEKKTGKLMLLIVEDNKDVLRYLRSLLSDSYNIVEANNGLKGFEKAIETIPDLVISDVMMPVMDGFTFCYKLKNDIRTSHIPIVLLTARADTESKMEGLGAGADAYLAKPFNRKELFVRIEKLIELRKLLQERFKAKATIPCVTESSENDDLLNEDNFMMKVCQMLELHLSDEEFGITELCSSLGMSRSQLYRKFAALTDTSVHQFILKLRLMKAKELLLNTELNVTEVAYDTGFKNLSHFSRVYSKEFGIAPSKARGKLVN